MKKITIALAGLTLTGVALVFALVLYGGPRMRVQPHIRTFQALFPAPPSDAVPADQNAPPPRATWAAAAPTPENIAAGAVYYGYYCVFCHGKQGLGNGPVGESYEPVPANLSARKIREYDDSSLLKAMLAGTGHDPVLRRVVHPQHYSFLLRYVRSLQQHDR